MKLDYLKSTLKHKWFVFKAGLKLKVPIWNLIIHDWSKLTLKEYKHYQRWFFENKDDPEGFAAAWLHHQNSQPHHWDYWITASQHSIGSQGDFNPSPLPMPEKYIREMVADWQGASLAYTGKCDIQPWLNDNYKKMCLHPKTILILDCILADAGYYFPVEEIHEENNIEKARRLFEKELKDEGTYLGYWANISSIVYDNSMFLDWEDTQKIADLILEKIFEVEK
jgi:hypothetical protein